MGINSSGLKMKMVQNQPKLKTTYRYISILIMYLAESTGWNTSFWESPTFHIDLKCCSFTTNVPRMF